MSASRFILILDFILIAVCCVAIVGYWNDGDKIIAFPSFILGMKLVQLLFTFQASQS